MDWITPLNALAKLAFSDLYRTLIDGTQKGAAAALQRMSVEPNQIFSSEVLATIIEERRRQSLGVYVAPMSQTSSSYSVPGLDSDMRAQYKDLGMVWSGHYQLTLMPPPSRPDVGFVMGKGSLGNSESDLLLCTKAFAKKHNISIRDPHARFSFLTTNRGLYLAGGSNSQIAQLSINGDGVRQNPYLLNQNMMNIRADKLLYIFQWGEFAFTEGFSAERINYMQQYFKSSTAVDMEMPTPLPGTRTMGRWTLGSPIGKGAVGRVFYTSNTSGDMAAVKLMEQTHKNQTVIDTEVKVCKALTTDAKVAGNNGRILGVLDTIYTTNEKFSSRLPFDNVAIVLTPLMPKTFSDWVGHRSYGGLNGMKIEAAAAFRDALLSVKALHDMSWVHRDLKPANIGIFESTPACCVLLDIGSAEKMETGKMIETTPGQVGTIGYIAPS
ncbi:MAG: hypothetical protein M1829_005083 [Trizodia sp. TS-e1964]|nr:MAG: hypothetical protein M1829_005083 [Trizodia sp. TS-e1964]